MSVDPNMLAQMLMTQGGGSSGAAPGALQTSNTASTAAGLIQKMMLIKALQNPQQPGQQRPPVDPNMLGQVAAQPQAMQAQQLPGGTNA